MSSFLAIEARAELTQILIDKTISDRNYNVWGGDNGQYVLITGAGILNGSITNSDSSNPGHVDVRSNGEYNTYENSTHFGTSNSYLDYVLVANYNTTGSPVTQLTISNNFYSNTVQLENSVLQLNNNSNISNIEIWNGDLEKKGQSTIIINTNYNNNTTFGYYNENLIKNVSLFKIEITNNNSLTLSNYAYVDNMILDNANSTVTLNNNGRIIGNVKGGTSGAGNVVLNINYNHEDTKFGAVSNKLNTIQVNNKNLTIQASDAYTNYVYANNLNLNGTSSILTIGDNGKIFGTISGNGKVVINTNYNGGTDTFFGNSTNNVSNMQITSGNSVALGNIAYINQTSLSNNSSLKLNSGSGLIGLVYGAGIVEVNSNYETSASTTSTTNATRFGNSTSQKLSTLNVNNATLTLGNTAYLDSMNLNNATLTLGNTIYLENMYLNSNSSILNINNGGIVNGVVNDATNGSATVNLNTNYNTTTNSTTFGVNGSSIGRLNLADSKTLSLTNLAYVNNLVLNADSSNTILAGNGGLMGAFTGNGILTLNKNYATTYGTADTSNNEYNTEFGKNGNKINVVDLNDNLNLTLGTYAYLNSLNLYNNSILTLKDNSAISGTIYGASTNSTVSVEGIFDSGLLGSANQTHFGIEGESISQLNVENNGSLTLTTNSYIDKINVNAPVSMRAPTLALKSISGSLTLNNISGISYDDINNIAVLVTLRNTTNNTNNEFMSQLYGLSQLLNTDSSLKDFTITNNNLYLDIMSRSQAEGDRFLIDSNTNINYFSEASLVYETIFKDLKLETTYNDLTNKNDLYLVVKMNRTPTKNDVSESTITSSNVIDSWKFTDRTENENILVLNIQNIDNKKDFFHALTNVSPNVSGLNVKIPTQSIISAVGNIDKRLSYFRMAKFDSKTNNYNIKNLSKRDIKYYDDYFMKPYLENNAWMEGFAGKLHQDTIDNVFGYDADFRGATLGYDVRVNSNFVFGISYTFNEIDANDIDYIKSSRDTLKAMTNNVDLYFMLYDKWNYLSLNVGGGYNKYNQERKIKFYNFDKTAKSDYKGYSYYGGVEYGINMLLFNNNRDLEKAKKRLKTKKLERINEERESFIVGPVNNFVMLTPKVSLTYNNIMIDDYVEDEADAANLIIKTKDNSSLDLNGGMALTLSRSLTKNISFQTILNGFASYNIINDKVELDARYIDDDKVFKVYGINPPDLTYNLGASLNFNFFDKIDLGLSYNYMFSEGFRGMIGRITLLWAF